MPPKKKAPEPSKKADQKKKDKIIEDKTFGLKNKKGAKNQKFIQQVEKQVKFGNQNAKKAADQQQVKGKKDDKKKEDLPLFRPAIVQKIEKGADPKSVLCAFFKQNQCTKGDKCKFSHDLSIERKSEKKNIYVDIRDDSDTIDSWDEAKLKEVVEKKHAEADKKIPKTDKICKYFLDALENSKYGWFWECPNGGDKCHYRHALPPGFVLKKDKKKEDKKDEISIEDLVETQRAALGPNQTRITLETFMQWKKKKIKEQEVLRIKEQDRRHAEFRAGRAVGLSGREVFAFQPELAGEDDMEEGEAALDYRMLEDGTCEVVVESCKEITLEDLTAQAQEVDGTGTVASTRHWQGETAAAAEGGEMKAAAATDMAIDENLFDEDDLEELEEHLEQLST